MYWIKKRLFCFPSSIEWCTGNGSYIVQLIGKCRNTVVIIDLSMLQHFSYHDIKNLFERSARVIVFKRGNIDYPLKTSSHMKRIQELDEANVSLTLL